MGITQPGFRSTQSGSGSPIVAMVQPAQPWLRADATGSRTGTSTGRCLLREARMRAVFVVVHHLCLGMLDADRFVRSLHAVGSRLVSDFWEWKNPGSKGEPAAPADPTKSIR